MKTNMEHPPVELVDLPDEILMKIFMKLNNVQILYSLINTSKRLDKIVRDSVFTNCLSLMRIGTSFIFSLNDLMIDRFCLQILPSIHYKIQSLNLESTSMKCILLAANYPKLTGLGLYNIQPDTASHLFTDEIQLQHIFKNQISTLIIAIDGNINYRSRIKMLTTMCTHIFTVFNNLCCLKFNDFSSNLIYRRLSFCLQLPTFTSSSLMELHINVSNIDDCLYILNGRFDQLHTFYVNIAFTIPWPTVENKKKLPNLRYFSMILKHETYNYDDLIVPLLHRIPNLETLRLFFEADHCKTFIDGNQLKKDIFSHMPHLNLFLFNIRSIIYIADQTSLPSNEHIQRTFINFENNQISSCTDYFPNKGKGQCHIYSHPYTMKHYNNITNNFPGGLYKCVEEVSLFDERPFEHEFFIQIAQALPFLESLTVSNWAPQNHKRCLKLNDDNQNFNVVKYSHLTTLNLLAVHDDYVEQFLVDNKTCLPEEICLSIYYNPLQRVTHNFTRDETRINCAKLTELRIAYEYGQHLNKVDLPKHFYVYFPHAEIL